MIEILAPCGSSEHVKAAVYAGADAVYLGGHAFSARRNAANFSTDELREAARFCRSYGVRLYVTVNILTRDNERDELRAFLRELALTAPDALIVQDIGTAQMCRSLLPDMPLHASTQMSIHTLEGLRFCEELGFSRVVIARECDKSTLSEIINNSKIGVEVFVHGALCVSVSGQCYLSALIGGRSGNRGLCAQPCRLDFIGGSKRFALSLKDLSLITDVPLLRDMGVSSLKIEGRMKRPEYVFAAVRACRAALSGGMPDMDELQAVFSRGGFTRGYFDGSFKNMSGIRSAEDVNESAAVLPKLSEYSRTSLKRVPVCMRFEMKKGRESRLEISDGAAKIEVNGQFPQRALSRETTLEEAERLLSRLGSTPFELSELRTEIEPNLMLPASAINAMRRKACDELLELRIERLTPVYEFLLEQEEPLVDIMQGASSSAPPLRAHCSTLGQAEALIDKAGQVVLDLDNAEAIDCGFDAEKFIISPDRFIINENLLSQKLLELKKKGFKRLLCDNPAHALIGRKLGYTLHGGFGLNVFNSESARFWRQYGLRDVTASIELRLNEARELTCRAFAGLVVYGRLPLMLLRRCPFERIGKRGTKCSDCPAYLSDRTKRRFSVRCFGGYRELLNADILWMADKLQSFNGARFLSLFFSDEGPEEALSVITAYAEGAKPPKDGFTRGLFTRGVE